MDIKEFQQMRKEAKDIFEGEELEIALATIDDLEEANKSFEQEPNIELKHPIPEYESLGDIESIKEYYAYKNGSKEQKKQIRNTAYLRRKKEDELIKNVQCKLKNPDFQNKVKFNFKKRQYLFRLSVLGLIATAITTLYIFNKLEINNQVSILVFVATFFGIYFYLGNKFWKCPACGFKMDFQSKYKGKGINHSSITKCPRCFAAFE